MPSTFAKAEIYKALASVSASQRVLDVLTELHGEALDEPPFVSTDIPDDASPAAVQDARQARTRGLYVALDPEKCALAYLLLRASGARTVVEAGTGFGLSTIYLALAVGQNAAAAGVARPGPAARVIATELEPAKAARARENWDRAGVEDVSRWVELRKGDLRHTLKENMPSQVDCLLLDSNLDTASTPDPQAGQAVSQEGSYSACRQFRGRKGGLQGAPGIREPAEQWIQGYHPAVCRWIADACVCRLRLKGPPPVGRTD
ncbi:hypothetical protein RB597_003138 [Gaeumannomyces tritici]